LKLESALDPEPEKLSEHGARCRRLKSIPAVLS